MTGSSDILSEEKTGKNTALEVGAGNSIHRKGGEVKEKQAKRR